MPAPALFRWPSPCLQPGLAAYALGQTTWGYARPRVVALSLQVGVNYANDYSDGIRGTDSPGAGRMALSGWSARISPTRRTCAAGAFVAFFLAALWGFALVALSEADHAADRRRASWRPGFTRAGGRAGYIGLGEVFVFVFGLVGTLGTPYAGGALTPEGVIGGGGRARWSRRSSSPTTARPCP